MSFLSQPISTLFAIGATRSFAGLTGYVTIQESTVDSLEITQQPVQQGAMIADHAFKKPVNLSVTMQFKDNPLQSLAQVYQSLLALQTPVLPATLAPFTVITPKRVYTNMLLSTLGLTTDKKTEAVLAISASFQEVLLVSVGTTIVPRSQLKNPGNNGGTQAVGKKSALKTLAQGIGLSP